MHSSELAKISFSTTKFREGYDMAEVDSFIDDAQKALEQWESGVPAQMSSESVVTARFRPTKFRLGYAQDEVDTFLDDVTSTLALLEKGRHL